MILLASNGEINDVGGRETISCLDVQVLFRLFCLLRICMFNIPGGFWLLRDCKNFYSETIFFKQILEDLRRIHVVQDIEIVS